MYRKIISILILILASLTVLFTGVFPFFSGTIDLNRELLLTFEVVINGIIGIVAGMYLLRKNKTGLLLSKLWSALQIPIIIYGVNGVIAFGINFQQVIKLNITFSSIQDFVLGINFFGLIMLVLVSRIKIDK